MFVLCSRVKFVSGKWPNKMNLTNFAKKIDQVYSKEACWWLQKAEAWGTSWGIYQNIYTGMICYRSALLFCKFLYLISSWTFQIFSFWKFRFVTNWLALNLIRLNQESNQTPGLDNLIWTELCDSCTDTHCFQLKQYITRPSHSKYSRWVLLLIFQSCLLSNVHRLWGDYLRINGCRNNEQRRWHWALDMFDEFPSLFCRHYARLIASSVCLHTFHTYTQGGSLFSS